MTAVSPATSNRRLLKLADFLDILPPARFDFRHYVGPDWDGKPDLSCGTSACALGHATTMPAFRRLGLRLVPVGTEFVVELRGGWGADAAAALFGITYDEAVCLFVPALGPSGPLLRDRLRSEATAKQVAAHIRRFVSERSAREGR